MKKLLISSLLITFHAFSEIRGLECFADYENKIPQIINNLDLSIFKSPKVKS